MARSGDGSAGDRDYGVIGGGYARYRRPDPRIAARIRAALGDARRVLNVGAGAGSYEPADVEVVAVEPSATMRAQRPADAAPCLDAVAEALPFADASFDAAMATVTLHQWPDARAGLAELRRVSRGPIVLLTFDPARMADFWLCEYAPHLGDAEAARYPSVEELTGWLGPGSVGELVPIPLTCTDGFAEAYYGRPEMFLDADARRAQSAWGVADDATNSAAIARLADDLASGAWDRRHGALRTQAEYEGSLVLVTG